MMYNWGYGGGMGYEPFNWLLMLLPIGLVVLGVILLVRYLARENHSHGHENNALEVLKTRYAKGEIDKQEFEEKRKALKD
jgi:putative membrane protein